MPLFSGVHVTLPNNGRSSICIIRKYSVFTVTSNW